jgi:hypothetical protein
MNIADLIKNASEKDALNFEKSFNSVMADKMQSAVSAKYDQMFGSEGGEEDLQPDLETEERDEE